MDTKIKNKIDPMSHYELCSLWRYSGNYLKDRLLKPFWWIYTRNIKTINEVE